MSRLPGLSVAEAWPRLTAADQDRIVTESAETLAALHAMNHAPLTDVLGPTDWARSWTAGAPGPRGTTPRTAWESHG